MSADKPNLPFSQPLNLRQALMTAPPRLDHVLPGLLAGTVGMLAGPGGVGKTMLELQIAVALATATPLCGGLYNNELGGATFPTRVVFVAAEESAEVMTHRLHAVVAAVLHPIPQQDREGFLDTLEHNLQLYPLGGGQHVTLLDREQTATRVSKSLLDVCAGARLVILDPLRQFHDCDENVSAAMNTMVRLLHGITRRTGAALVFAHHTNRASTQMGLGDTAGAARGSTALTDGVRWQLNVSKPTKEWAKAHGMPEAERGRHLLADVAKANYLPPQPTRLLERLAGGVLRVVGAEAEARTPRTGSSSMRLPLRAA